MNRKLELCYRAGFEIELSNKKTVINGIVLPVVNTKKKLHLGTMLEMVRDDKMKGIIDTRYFHEKFVLSQHG